MQNELIWWRAGVSTKQYGYLPMLTFLTTQLSQSIVLRLVQKKKRETLTHLCYIAGS